MKLELYSRTGGSTFSRKAWRRLACVIAGAREHKADVRAVARGCGCSSREAEIAQRLTQLDAAELASLLCAALSRDRTPPRAARAARAARRLRARR